MAFDPKETIKKFQDFIHSTENNKSETVEISLNEFRQFFNDFQILNRQAERSLEAIGELKELADHGKLLRVAEATSEFKGFKFNEDEQNRISRNFPDFK